MIGIIGGSGLYNIDQIEWLDEKEIDTPYGKPSSNLKIGKIKDKKVVFLARHGNQHQYPPHKVNYRANIWALKKLGVNKIVAFSAVGSLQEKYERGHICIVDQFMDFTKNRDRTYYDDKAVHVSMANPYCPHNNNEIAYKTIEQLKMPVHNNVTYVCIEGPSFSTKAESEMYRKLNGDIIGMTGCPETQLARELGLCYTSICTVTDYDCWKDEPVSAEEVKNTVKENENNIKKIMIEIINNLNSEKNTECNCKNALEGAEL